MHIKTWHVELFLYEDGDDTSARAVLHSDALEHPEGYGRARRAPKDVSVPEIGDELAVARALHALADALLASTSQDISAIEHQPVQLDFSGPTSVSTRTRPQVPGTRPAT
jgi:hypothetical protein